MFFEWATVHRTKIGQYSQSRRGKSRNKVAVGEPAAGSFSDDYYLFLVAFLDLSLDVNEKFSASGGTGISVCD